MTRAEIIERRKLFRIKGYRYKTVAEVDFEGKWVSPSQISSCSMTGPVLVAYHWFDAFSIEKYKPTLKKLGYEPDIKFGKVLTKALESVDLGRSDIYVTQAFHLIPEGRSQYIPVDHLKRSFYEITQHELRHRQVISLGNAAHEMCRRFDIEDTHVLHPSARGKSIDELAKILGAALKKLKEQKGTSGARTDS